MHAPHAGSWLAASGEAAARDLWSLLYGTPPAAPPLTRPPSPAPISLQSRHTRAPRPTPPAVAHVSLLPGHDHGLLVVQLRPLTQPHRTSPGSSAVGEEEGGKGQQAGDEEDRGTAQLVQAVEVSV